MEEYCSDINSSKLSWLNEMKPNKTSELIGDHSNIIKIKSWLKTFKKMKQLKAGDIKTRKKVKKSDINKSNIILTGSHGVGKTLTIELILKELGYEPKILTYDGIKDKLSKGNRKDKYKNIDDILNELTGKNDIVNVIHNEKQKDVAIIVDELESFSSNNDKTFVHELQKTNNIEWYFPIIFISNERRVFKMSPMEGGPKYNTYAPGFTPQAPRCRSFRTLAKKRARRHRCLRTRCRR